MSDTNPLLNNFSVQGAAKSIEGILDPNTATIKPQQEATPVEPKEPKRKPKIIKKFNNNQKLNKKKFKKLL
jgi:hypothetical protein